MLNRSYILTLLLYLLVSNRQVFSQCSPRKGIWDSLKKIEENTTASDAENLVQLQKLHQVYLKCYAPTDSIYARIVHRIGGIYSKTGDTETAIKFTKEAVSVNVKGTAGTDRSFLANSYFNLSTFYSQLYLYEDSHRALDECIAVSRQFPSKYFLTTMAFEQKSYAFFQTGDYQKSTETADTGILFAKEIDDHAAEASLLSQKAQAQIELNDLQKAEENIKKAISIFSGDIYYADRLATSYSVYAQLLTSRGDLKSAVNYYKKSFALNETNAHWVQCSRDMLNLGYLYDYHLHDAPNALLCYKKGLDMIDKSNDDYQRAGLYINMGVLYWRHKDYQQALQYYQKALNALPIHFADPTVKSNPTATMLALVSNDYFVSTLLANKAEAFLDLYKVKRNKDLLAAALSTYQLADKAVDLMRWKQYGEQSKLFWRGKTKKMYENAIEACHLANDANLAFFFMEKSRAVLLNDKLNELGASAKLPAAEIQKDQEYRVRVITAQQKWASSSAADKQQSEKNQAKLLQAKTEFESYIRSLEKKYPAYYQYKYTADVPSLKDLQTYLSERKASFVHYFISDSVTYILAITPENARLTKLSKKQFDPEKLGDFVRLCAEKQALINNYSTFATLSHRLYRELFQPLQLPKGKVIICADGFLVPFDALSKDAQGRQPLLHDHIFDYVYSAGFLLKYFAPAPAQGNFIGFAPVHFQPYLQVADLKKAGSSLQEAAAFYSSSKIFTGEASTKNNFANYVTGYNIANVFSHASADEGNSEPLLFMQDSVIRLSELQLSRNLATRLVILSACETNVGKNATGEGIYSLARGFTSAGIPSIAATLWKADEQAIYDISIIFHKYLAKGLPKDEALQQAKLDFIAGNSLEKSLPYYWANMVLIGNADPVELSNHYIWWLTCAAAIAVIIFTAIIYRRKRKLSTKYVAT
jgi:CHAT domain-containing protein/tetratricopeptide (TPR) repeat protein